jgi:hypothetical protein
MERLIMDEWHELEEAKKKIQLDQQRERAAQAAMAAIDPVEAKSERAMQILKIQERIEPDQEKIQELIDDWHLVVCQHLAEIANATWGEKIEGRFSWILKGKVIWSEESQTPSLFWLALRRQPYNYAWYTVELRTDLDASPLRFVVSCKESTFTISADLTIDALKSALVTAFKLGPIENIFYEDIPGIPFE